VKIKKEDSKMAERESTGKMVLKCRRRKTLTEELQEIFEKIN